MLSFSYYDLFEMTFIYKLPVVSVRSKIGKQLQERMVIEDPNQKLIVASIHDTSHMGLNRTTDVVAGKYYWPGLMNDVKAYVSYTYVYKHDMYY